MRMKKLFAGIAAAATMLGGMALGATAANAADPVVVTGDQQITFTASEEAMLENRDLKAYKIGEYVKYTNGTDVSYGIQTVAGENNAIKNEVRAALNKTVFEDSPILNSEDPLATALSQEPAALDIEEVNPYTGSSRQFVTALTRSSLGTATSVELSKAVGSEGEYSATVTLPAGLWVIYDDSATNPSVPILIGTAPVNKNATVNMKNHTTPTPSKTVTGDTDGTVTIGQKLSYTVTDKLESLVNYDTYSYVIGDTPGNGLTVDLTSVKVNGKTVSEIQGAKLMLGGKDTTEKSFDGDGDTAFTVEMNLDALKSLFGEKWTADTHEITLTYTATVNRNATATVDNKAVVNHNGQASGEGTHTVYTNDFSFTKVWADGTPAEGAVFTISGDNLPEGYGTATATSNEKGVVSFKGLADGTYTVTETTVAPGATNVKGSFTVTLKYDKDNDKTDVTFGDSATSDPFGLVNIKDGVLTVTNVKSITELPKTGAAGIAMFTVLGLLIAGAAVAVYVKSSSIRRSNMA